MPNFIKTIGSQDIVNRKDIQTLYSCFPQILQNSLKHLLSSGQSVFDLQLQPNSDLFGYKIFLLLIKQMFKTILMIRRNFTLGVLNYLLRKRFRNHIKEFSHKKYRNSTEFSKYVWQLKDANITSIVTWKVVAKAFSDTKINFSKLCLTGKVFMINALNDTQFLNKKSELINTCRHQNKLLLKCLKRNNKRHDSMDQKFKVQIILNSCCSIYFLCFLDIKIKMYT